MIVSVVNNKGGIGKTTTTVILAQTALQRGVQRILVVDACGQQNAVDYLMIGSQALFDGIDVMPSPGKTPDPKILQSFDLTIIDTPPHTESIVVRNVINVADVVVVPYMLEKHALMGLDEVFAIIPPEKTIPLCVLPRNANSYTKVLMEDARKKINKLGVQFLSWPNYSRIEKNLGNRDDFFKGLTDAEMERFMVLINKILPKRGAGKKNGKKIV